MFSVSIVATLPRDLRWKAWTYVLLKALDDTLDIIRTAKATCNVLKQCNMLCRMAHKVHACMLLGACLPAARKLVCLLGTGLRG